MISKNDLFEQIAEQLDIPPYLHARAVDRYEAVGKYLDTKSINAHIYPQGSFRLGTVVRPIKNGADADYDVDLVCKFNINKSQTIPKIVKNTIGNALKENGNYSKLLEEEGRRCWTLVYSDSNAPGFHLDILPSVQESSEQIGNIVRNGVDLKFAINSIAITNRIDLNNYEWGSSNPFGYADWFDEINMPFYRMIEFDKKRGKLYESNKTLYASVDAVPTNLIKTPLQRVIQILKRHRDMRFSGTSFEDCKPISMIITTLVAQIVKNQQYLTPSVEILLQFVLDRIDEYAGLIQNEKNKMGGDIITRDFQTGKWYFPNPANPYDNFAERWHEDNQKCARAFFEWVKWAKVDLSVDTLNKKSLEISFGKNLVEKAYANLESSSTPNIIIQKPAPIPIVNPGRAWSTK